MVKYAVSNEGVNALNKLNTDLNKNNNDIINACSTLQTTINGLGSTIGIFEEQLNQLISAVRNAQKEGEEGIEQLSGRVSKLASEVAQIVANANNIS